MEWHGVTTTLFALVEWKPMHNDSMSHDASRSQALSALLDKDIARLVRLEQHIALEAVPEIIREIESGACQRLGLMDDQAAGILFWYYRSGWSRLSCIESRGQVAA